MSADQQSFNNELRGALFKNDKGDNPARPDYRGRSTIEGKTYRVSAWIRTARATGAKYMSLAYTHDPGQPDAQAQATAPVQASDFAPAQAPAEPDDIPF